MQEHLNVDLILILFAWFISTLAVIVSFHCRDAWGHWPWSEPRCQRHRKRHRKAVLKEKP